MEALMISLTLFVWILKTKIWVDLF